MNPIVSKKVKSSRRTCVNIVVNTAELPWNECDLNDQQFQYLLADMNAQNVDQLPVLLWRLTWRTTLWAVHGIER